MGPGVAKAGAENAPPEGSGGEAGPAELHLHTDMEKACPREVLLCSLAIPTCPHSASAGPCSLRPEQSKRTHGTRAKTRELEGRSPNQGINCPVAQTCHSASPKLNFLIWKLGRSIPVCPYPPTRHDVGRGRGCTNEMRSQIGSHTKTQHPVTCDSSFMTSPA